MVKASRDTGEDVHKSRTLHSSVAASGGALDNLGIKLSGDAFDRGLSPYRQRISTSGLGQQSPLWIKRNLVCFMGISGRTGAQCQLCPRLRTASQGSSTLVLNVRIEPQSGEIYLSAPTHLVKS